MIVKDILYRNEDIDYGLNVIFKLDDNTFLLFDSIGFSFVEKANLLDNKWKHCSYWKNKSQINGIYEDELTAYFVVFSNGDILYIYQFISGDERIRQEMRFVLPNDSDYNDIISYMNEDWIDVWYSKTGSMNRIIFRSGDKTHK